MSFMQAEKSYIPARKQRRDQQQMYTPFMSLKTAALFAFVGMLLLTVLLAAGFVRDLLSFLSGLIPVLQLFTSLIHLVAALSVTMFLYVFHRSQS